MKEEYDFKDARKNSYIRIDSMKKLKLPTGIDNFKKIRNNNYYYVDKTSLIEQILENGSEVTLFTRPRRFGKSLNMSMLQNFFEIGADLEFSVGKHNQLQKAIIEEFAPRFAENSECLYVGDTIKKDLVKNVEKLTELGFEITLHDKMPDIVLYREDKDWIYFIESVTSVEPMDAKRILEINEMTKSVKSGKIFVTAFLDFKTYKKFAEQLAWETEVWIAELPEHMIHLDGDKFMGPR